MENDHISISSYDFHKRATDAKNELVRYRDFGFREFQEEAIRFIFESEKKYIFLEAPTGSGKSLIAMTSGILHDGVTYSVHSKILQRQITEDFPEAQSLFGRSNYPCVLHDGFTCDECSHTQYTPCKFKQECEYEKRKTAVLNSRLKILNYDYLMTEANYIKRFSGSDFNIVDEADNLESALINFITLNFTEYALRQIGMGDDIDSLHKTSKNKEHLISTWLEFAREAKGRVERKIRRMTKDINFFPKTNLTEPQKKVISNRTHFQRLQSKIDLFLNNADSTWLYDDSQPGCHIFRPLWLTEELSRQYMWQHAKKWCLMSASFLPVHLEAKRLGIPWDEVDYKIIPSTFPPERRQIHINPVANLTGKTMDEEIPKLTREIKRIVNSHPKEKGLIHGVSYKLSMEIEKALGSPRVIIHDSTNRQEMLDKFMASDYPYVLISPSMERGVSLEMDLCRFIIVAKAPFLYLGDKIVAARVYSSKLGNEWYAATMLSTVLQMTGRGMRSKDDFCVSYILDEQFQRVFNSRPKFLPQWWREAVAW